MSRIAMMVMLWIVLLPVLSGCSGGGGGASAGPVATTVWQQVNAPEAGHINALAVDPADHLTLYAATNNSGVFKSTNGGASWSRANSSLAQMQVYCIAVDPTDSQTIYAGTDSGMYKSTNAAASWSAANSGLSPNFTEAVLSIAIDSTDSRNIFIGCGGGVYHSSNAGGSWTCVYGGLVIPTVAVDPRNSQIIFAGTSSGYGSESGRTADDVGVLKSSDGGRTWQTVNNDTGYVRSVFIDATDSSIVYACADLGLFKSTDGGVSWGFVYGEFFNDAATGPSGQTIYALVNDNLSSSTDGGVHWNVLGTPLAGMQTVSLAVDPTNSQTIYVGTYGAGVFKSVDGGVSWNAVNTGLTAASIKAAVVAGSGGVQNIYVGTQSGIFKSADAGASWSGATNQPGSINSLVLDPRTPQTLYAGRDFGGVFKSGNGGESWSAVNEGLGFTFEGDSYTYYHNPESLAVDPADGTIYAGTDAGLYKSSNGGASWSAVAGLTGNVLALAIDPRHSGTVYAGTYDGVFKSVDGGTSWMAMNAGLSLSKMISSLVIDPSNTQILYAGSTYGVYRSTDGGNTWATNSTTPMYYVSAVAIDPTTKTVYAVSRGALYKTTDRGNSWSLVPIATANSGEITDIAINGSTLCVVTDGGAVFKGSTVWQ